jgi:hypothetical protein
MTDEELLARIGFPAGYEPTDEELAKLLIDGASRAHDALPETTPPG